MYRMPGPMTVAADHLHSEKYRLDGENFRDSMNRIASSLQDNKQHFHEFKEILTEMRFLPGGRIQSAMGAPKQVTAFNCYVSGTVPDSFTKPDNPERSCIMDRAKEAAETLRMGGGLGTDFSTLRPHKALISTIGSMSTGPVHFMGIWNAVGDCASSTGERRGAQMGVLRIDHPSIMRFINAKHDNHSLNRFNISVAVTDHFMECLAGGLPFDLSFKGQHYDTVNPRELWDVLMRSTWDWGEPGVMFIDRINDMNNLYYCEKIAATNPCGEQPLPPYGACLLGSFNLVKYIREGSDRSGVATDWDADNGYYFDWDQFKHDIPIVVRAMDNVTDRTIYPLGEQKHEAQAKRRMGLGCTGLANTMEILGAAYGSSEGITFTNEICRVLTRECYIASAHLASEKGSFPLYDHDKYLAGKFVKTLDEEVRDNIKIHGMRNSHLTSWAPTGTISQCADNISSSLEPVYQWRTTRPIEFKAGKMNVEVYDYAFKFYGVRGRRASRSEISVDQHLDMLTTVAKHTDSSVSKTINTDGSINFDTFKKVYEHAYERGAKSCTTFNKDGKRSGLFKAEVESDNLPFPEHGYGEIGHRSKLEMDSCTFDPATGRRTCE